MVDFSKLFSEYNLDYFLAPKQTGYDVPKTLLYAIVLVVAAYYIYKILKKLKVKINRELAIAVSPYVVLGAMIRVLQDAGTIDSYLFMTPGIYFFVFGITFSVLVVSYFVERRFGIGYYKISFVVGLFLLSFALSHLYFSNFYGGFLVGLFFVPWICIIGIKRIRWAVENKIVTLVHLFDATTTFVSLQFFGYYEQHVLPTALINALGPFSFIVLKVVAIVAMLVIIDRFSNDKDFNNYIKLIIGILGAATGTRDFISLLSMI
jgi:uncharacterized membrane protein